MISWSSFVFKAITHSFQVPNSTASLKCNLLICGNDHQFVVYFLLGKSPASVFYWPTFRNSLSVPSSKAGDLPKRKYTTFRTRRKLKINDHQFVFQIFNSSTRQIISRPPSQANNYT
jgi:hypothetical protein